MPLGYPFWVWLKNTPAAQYALVAVALFIAFRLWLWRKIVGVRKQEAIKYERAATKEKERAVEYIETVREEAADAADKAIEARNTASPLDPERMPDAKYTRIFGRARPSEEGS